MPNTEAKNLGQRGLLPAPAVVPTAATVATGECASRGDGCQNPSMQPGQQLIAEEGQWRWADQVSNPDVQKHARLGFS
jgi:hypothetical protein